MIKFEVDITKCIRCGLCSQVCPFGIIAPPDGEKPPASISEREAYCIKCGQCQAVCPSGASDLSYDEAVTTKYQTDKKFIAPEKIADHMRLRRSVRKFKEDLVSKEVIEELLDVARYAPSGTNRQPVRWIVTHSPEKVQKLAAGVIEWMELAAKQDLPFAKILPLAVLVRAWKSGMDPIFHKAPHIITACAH
jgi:ferredoxin